MQFTVYILRTSSNTLYTGHTSNLAKRLEEHTSKKGQGAKYMRYFTFCTLVYTESYATRSEAMRREAQIKKLTKTKKEILISDNGKSRTTKN